MRLNRPLGNVQIPSDLRIVTTLQEQIDDLPLPRPDLAEILFHKYYT
jgi:hypothetical protein